MPLFNIKLSYHNYCYYYRKRHSETPRQSLEIFGKRRMHSLAVLPSKIISTYLGTISYNIILPSALSFKIDFMTAKINHDL